MTKSNSVLEVAFPAALFFVAGKSLKSAGADPLVVQACEYLAMFCAFAMVVRMLAIIAKKASLLGLRKPKGIHGRVEELNGSHPKKLGLATDNKHGDGLFLGSMKWKGKKELPIFYTGNGHGLVISGTSGGKTQSLSKNWVTSLGKHHNKIITMKGADICVATYRYHTEILKHKVIAIDPYRLLKKHGIKSDDFNPCQQLVDLANIESPDILDQARIIALTLIPEEISASGGDNKIFRSVARTMIADVLVYLAIEQASTGELVCNLAYLNRLLNSGTEDVMEVFRRMTFMPDYEGAIARAGKKYISQFGNNPRSAQSFVTQAQDALTIFESVTPIGRSCEHSTFRASDIKNKDINMTIFITMPPEKSGLNDAYAGLCLNSLCTIAIEADSFFPQVTIIADEFENLSTTKLDITEKILKIGRTRGVRLMALVQDAKSLKARYGELSNMFWTNSAILMAMDIRSVDEAKEYSERSGKKALMTDGANIPDDDDYSISVKEEGADLARLDLFTRLPKFTAVLFKEDNPPTILNLIHYKQIEPWRGYIDDVPGSPPEEDLPVKFKF